MATTYNPFIMPTYSVPKYEAPEVGSFNAPSYSLPQMNQGVISSYRQKAAAPGLRGLRNQLREGLARTSAMGRDNPFAAKQQFKAGLAGYGEGLSGVMAQAGRQAMEQYMPEYQAQVGASQMKYKTDYDRSRSIWEADQRAKQLAAQAEYQAMLDKSKTEYQSAFEKEMAEYQADLQQQALEQQLAHEAEMMAKKYEEELAYQQALWEQQQAQQKQKEMEGQYYYKDGKFYYYPGQGPESQKYSAWY